MVLTPSFLLTFKERRSYENPTEVIVLKEVLAIKAADEEVDRTFTFVHEC